MSLLVWSFLIEVYFHMCCQHTPSRISLVTNTAKKWSIIQMTSFNVDGPRSKLTKRFVAKVALVRFFFSVNPNVLFQRCFFTEVLAAQFTIIRFNLLVWHQMMFKVCQSWKIFSTNRAQIFLFFMYHANMTIESRTERKWFATVRAVIRYWIMALAMKFQVPYGGKSFVAERTSGLAIQVLSAMNIVALICIRQKLFSTKLTFQNLSIEIWIVSSFVRPHSAITTKAFTTNIANKCFWFFIARMLPSTMST